MRAHGGDLDDRPGQGHVERFLALAEDGQLDIAADLAAHLFDRLRQGQALDRFTIEMGNQIAGFDPGTGGGRVVDG